MEEIEKKKSIHWQRCVAVGSSGLAPSQNREHDFRNVLTRPQVAGCFWNREKVALFPTLAANKENHLSTHPHSAFRLTHVPSPARFPPLRLYACENCECRNVARAPRVLPVSQFIFHFLVFSFQIRPTTGGLLNRLASDEQRGLLPPSPPPHRS